MATRVSFATTFNTTAGNKTVTFTPLADSLLIVCFGASGTSAPPVASITDNRSGTYALVTSATFTISSNAFYAAVAIRNSVTTNVSHIVTMTQTGDTGGGLSVVEYGWGGLTRVGTSAGRQFGGQSDQAASTTPAPGFSVAALTGNPCITFIVSGTNGPGITGPTGWAAAENAGYNSPTTGIESFTRDSGFTGTTVTWGGTSATKYASIALELDVSGLPASVPVLAMDTYRRRRVK